MNILFVTETLPYPLDRGGFIRSSYLIRELCRKHKVTLLTSQEGSKSRQGVEYFKQFCEKVICLPKPKPSAKRTYACMLSSLVATRPYPLNKNFSTAIFKCLKKELGSGKYHVLHCDHLDTAQYLPLIQNPPHTVFDTHNLLSILIERLSQQEKSFIKRFLIRHQSNKIKTFEMNLCEKFDRCLVCSEQDKEQLRQLSPKSKIEIIPNGVDLDYYKIEAMPPKYPTLLFIGRLDYLPNSQGVLDFYKNVWPIVCKEIPQIQWQIIGGDLPSSLLDLANNSNIQLIANAEDMRPFLANSTLSIVPLHIGGGTRLKILESMAAGIPVVSTSIGAEGITAVNGKEIIITDDPQTTAKQIINLCNDPETRQKLAQNARNFVSQYDWKLIGKKLLSCYNLLY